MTESEHGPVHFDPASSDLPSALSTNRLSRGGAGRVVAFVVSGDTEWAPRAAVSVARHWSDDGVRVFLADLDLHDPKIHTVLGVENREGITDAFQFGASVQRVAQRIGDGSFFFASAGTPTGDSTTVFAHPRWSVLAEGFEEAGAALLLYLPVDIPGSAEVLCHATDIVWLAPDSDVPRQKLPPTDAEVLAWVTRPAGWKVRSDSPEATGEHDFGSAIVDSGLAAAASAPLTTRDEEGETAGASVEERGGEIHNPFDADPLVSEEELEPASAGEPGFSDLGLTDAPTSIDDLRDPTDALSDSPFAGPAPARPGKRTRWKSSRRRSPVVPVLGVVALLAASGYFAWDRGWLPTDSLMGAGGGGSAETAAATDVTPSVPPTAADVEPETPEPTVLDRAQLGEPVAPLLGHSLVVLSERSAAAAAAKAAELSEEDGDLLFIVTPALVNGDTWYRVLAGPATDVAEIPGIRAAVAATGKVSGADDWFVRRTNLAFMHAELSSVEMADTRASELRDRGVPAYVLEVEYSGGRSLYRVYSGGYANAGEAASLSELLASIGDTARLTNRIGTLPR